MAVFLAYCSTNFKILIGIESNVRLLIKADWLHLRKLYFNNMSFSKLDVEIENQ
jgi:hypothetical protein